MTIDILGFLINLAPIIYIIVKDGREKLLFCASCYGIVAIISATGELTAWPIKFLFFDNFENFFLELGFFNSISEILNWGELIYNYFPIVFYIIAILTSPIVIYRRYDIFKNKPS